VRVGLVILPTDRWPEARTQWEWADDAGFCTAWTYDHIRWGGMPNGPWHAALPVLAAAAGVTERIRLGTLVATPNFRHPVTLARDVLALDDLSDGRFDLGIGPGSEGPDATALGTDAVSPAERMDRFAEFMDLLRAVLNGSPEAQTDFTGRFYSADAAPSTPGALQSPFPLTVAAGGRRGLELATSFGSQWVTIGVSGPGPRTAETMLLAVQQQCELLTLACARQGRDTATLRKVLLWTPTEPTIESLPQFEELVAPYIELGFDQLVVHHPAQTGPYGGSIKVFEDIAAHYAAESD